MTPKWPHSNDNWDDDDDDNDFADGAPELDGLLDYTDYSWSESDSANELLLTLTVMGRYFSTRVRTRSRLYSSPGEAQAARLLRAHLSTAVYFKSIYLRRWQE